MQPNTPPLPGETRPAENATPRAVRAAATPRAGKAGAVRVLTRRELNRITLERQMLLRRGAMPVLDAVEHLVALQAQEPNPPYFTLWSRLEDFRQDALTELLHDRRIVRSSLLRGTQHMASAADYPWLRPLIQPALSRARQAAFGRRTDGMDLAELAAAGRGLLAGRTLTRPQLRRLLTERWPDREPAALVWSVQALLPVVHTPPSGTWGKGGATPFTLAEEWLGRSMVADPAPEAMIRRYLASFGPAGIMDVQMWSGLTRLREVVDRMRPELRTYQDETGRELFDLPDAPMAAADAPAPARFLPYFDNLIVAYADRTRLMTDERRRQVCIGAVVKPTILVDGFVAGTWTLDQKAGTATLTVEPFGPLSGRDAAALAEEGARLLAFAAPGANAHDIRL